MLLNWERWWDTMIVMDADDGGSGGGGGDAGGNDDGGEGPDLALLQAELADVRKALKAANKEAADRRVKLQELETAEEERKQAELSEVEKAQQRAQEAEQKLTEALDQQNQRTIRYAVEMAAHDMNFHDAGDAYRLADLDGVEIDDKGNVTGVEDALKSLAKTKPHLIKGTEQQGGGDINAANRGRQNAPTQDELVAQKRRSGQYVPI